MKTQWICAPALLVAMAVLVACGVQKAVVTITNKSSDVAAGTSVVLNATVTHIHHPTGTVPKAVTWSMTRGNTDRPDA